MLLFPDRMKYREFRVIFFLPTLFYLYLAEISLSCGLPWLPIVELLYICLYLKIQLDLDLKLDTCLLKELQIMWLFCCCSSLSHMWIFATLRTAARRASLFFTISQSLLKLMSIELVMPSKHLVFCHPLLLLPSIFSSIRIFSNESALCIRWPKYWSFSISLSKEYSGLSLVGSPCSARDSQEYSPTPQFKSINYLALTLHGTTLTSTHDYWKNHSFD